MKKLIYFIAMCTVLLLIFSSCNTDPEHRNQVRMAGIWKIKKIQTDQYENGSIVNTFAFEGDHLGEITFLNLDRNDFNDCYMWIDSNVNTQFETNFNAVVNEDVSSKYYASQWGTNPSTLKYVNFYEIDVEPVNAKSWTVSIENRKLKKQKWVYTHFNTSGILTHIETFEIEK